MGKNKTQATKKATPTPTPTPASAAPLTAAQKHGARTLLGPLNYIEDHDGTLHQGIVEACRRKAAPILLGTYSSMLQHRGHPPLMPVLDRFLPAFQAFAETVLGLGAPLQPCGEPEDPSTLSSVLQHQCAYYRCRKTCTILYMCLDCAAFGYCSVAHREADCDFHKGKVRGALGVYCVPGFTSDINDFATVRTYIRDDNGLGLTPEQHDNGEDDVVGLRAPGEIVPEGNVDRARATVERGAAITPLGKKTRALTEAANTVIDVEKDGKRERSSSSTGDDDATPEIPALKRPRRPVAKKAGGKRIVQRKRKVPSSQEVSSDNGAGVAPPATKRAAAPAAKKVKKPIFTPQPSSSSTSTSSEEEPAAATTTVKQEATPKRPAPSTPTPSAAASPMRRTVFGGVPAELTISDTGMSGWRLLILGEHMTKFIGRAIWEANKHQLAVYIYVINDHRPGTDFIIPRIAPPQQLDADGNIATDPRPVPADNQALVRYRGWKAINAPDADFVGAFVWQMALAAAEKSTPLVINVLPGAYDDAVVVPYEHNFMRKELKPLCSERE